MNTVKKLMYGTMASIEKVDPRTNATVVLDVLNRETDKAVISLKKTRLDGKTYCVEVELDANEFKNLAILFITMANQMPTIKAQNPEKDK